jgi:hypothetical protein
LKSRFYRFHEKFLHKGNKSKDNGRLSGGLPLSARQEKDQHSKRKRHLMPEV